MLTEEQKLQRQNGIGGSDMPVILGLTADFKNPKTPLDLYFEKVDGVSKTTENFAMKRGNAMEPVILEEYEKITGNIVYKHKTIYDKKDPFLFANIDGFVENDQGKIGIVVEAKSINRKNSKWGEPGSDEIPDYYLAQVAHYAYITDCERVDIAVDFRDNVEIYHYFRNLDLEKMLRLKARNFWNAVQKKQPPAPTTVDDVKILYKVHDIPAEADQHIIDAVEEMKEVKEAIKKAKLQENKIKTKIAVYMQGAQSLVVGKKVLATYREQQGSKRIDSKLLRKEQPIIAEKYTVQSEPVRKLLIK